MELPLSTLPPRAGPPLLDVLASLAHHHPDAEMALLHSANGSSASVLAANPLVTLEADAQGAARLSTHMGLALPPPVPPLAALQTAVDSFHFVPPHPLVASGFRSVGCMPCTSRSESNEDARAGRWRGKGKTECGIHTMKVS